jgi:hypothetical protein
VGLFAGIIYIRGHNLYSRAWVWDGKTQRVWTHCHPYSPEHHMPSNPRPVDPRWAESRLWVACFPAPALPRRRRAQPRR